MSIWLSLFAHRGREKGEAALDALVEGLEQGIILRLRRSSQHRLPDKNKLRSKLQHLSNLEVGNIAANVRSIRWAFAARRYA